MEKQMQCGGGINIWMANGYMKSLFDKTICSRCKVNLVGVVAFTSLPGTFLDYSNFR